MIESSDVRKTLRMDRPRRGWLWGTGAVIVVAAIGATFIVTGPGRAGKYTYRTEPVARGELAVKVTAVGSLEPSNAIDISSELSGIVARVFVDENDEVEAGELLAELDTELLEAQARQSRWSVSAAEATLARELATVEESATELERARALHAAQTISDSERERAETSHRKAVATYALAEAQLQQARASSQAARTNLDKARIVSPIHGVILARTVDEGQAVVSSLQAATMFRVAEDLSQMTVDVEVDEADVGRIHSGQKADFTVAAFPDRVFDAVVTKVNLAPNDTSGVVTYLATLSLDNPDRSLLPGMTATASITTEVFTDALLVPSAALRFLPEDTELPPVEPLEGQRRARIWVLDGESIEPVIVVPKATEGGQTVVEGPVQPGQEVVIAAERTRKRDAPP